MSSGLPNDSGRPANNVFLSTVTALVVCMGLALLLYFVWGKEFIDSQRIAHSNKEKVEQIDEALSIAEKRSQATESSIASLQDQLRSGQAVSPEQLNAILGRLQELESDRANQSTALEAVSRQASAIEDSFSRNRVQIIEAARTSETVRGELDALKGEITTWNDTLTPLALGDNGRRIAEYPDLVEKYETVLATKVVSMERHDIWNEQLLAVHPRVKLAYESKDNSLVVGDETVELLHELLSEIRDVRAALRRQQRALDGIISSARDTDPGDRTLQEVLDAKSERRGLARLEDATKRRREQEQLVDEAYAERFALEHRQQREAAQQARLVEEEQRTLAEKRGLTQAQGQLEELQAEVAANRLRDEFARDRGTIDSLLAPFLDFAITQPSSHGITKGGIQRPTSLGALQSSGALADTRQGLDRLYQFGGHPANLRKKGSFPAFVSMSPIRDEGTRQQVRRAQQLLVKYGEVMVEEGLLEP